ncbi:Zinc finger, CHCC-type, partial [Cynara cardunculus var. scolymus]
CVVFSLSIRSDATKNTKRKCRRSSTLKYPRSSFPYFNHSSSQLISMATIGAKRGYAMASNFLKALKTSSSSTSVRRFSGVVNSEITTTHTAKWMQLINEVPPIKVEGRIVACEGDTNPALGHPIEFICLDLSEPAVCKYCGLRYVQDHHH